MRATDEITEGVSRMAKTYAEKLKDPRWQKKRLEVLEREDFKCEWCGDSDNTLHVHHWYYDRGKDPWEYPAAHLSALCEDCHSAASGSVKWLTLAITKVPGLKQEKVFNELRGHAKGIALALAPDPAVEEFTLDELYGAFSAWGLPGWLDYTVPAELEGVEVIGPDELDEGTVFYVTFQGIMSFWRATQALRFNPHLPVGCEVEVWASPWLCIGYRGRNDGPFLEAYRASLAAQSPQADDKEDGHRYTGWWIKDEV